MTLFEQAKRYLNVELGISSPSIAEVYVYIDEWIKGCGSFEYLQQELNDWMARNPPDDEELNVCSINSFAKANPSLCMKALQEYVSIGEGMSFYIDSIHNILKFQFEGVNAGCIYLLSGMLLDDEFQLMLGAKEHIKHLFPGVWKENEA